MPSAKGAVAVPTNIALPAVASIVPLNSVEIYEESPTRTPGTSVTASKLLPLYRARGYYGPTPTDWEDQEYDLVAPHEASDSSYLPTAFAEPPGPSIVPHNHAPKKVKVVKINETPRKKIVRKNKPKRLIVRGRPQLEEEHPVSVFHEQFYSELDGSGTIRKIKKPPRVEKIIDGDTEHIHTYNEEHIHKLVLDDDAKISGIHSAGGVSSLPVQHSLIPLRSSQPILTFSPDTLTGYTAIGSMGTPSHLEYAAYNPRDVTHDHIFHDHGEIPPELDIIPDPSSTPLRISHAHEDIRNGGVNNRIKNKYMRKYGKPTTTPFPDLSYENMYSSVNKIKKLKFRPTSQFDTSSENVQNDFRPIPDFNFKNKRIKKTKNLVPAFDFNIDKHVNDYGTSQTGIQDPFSVSSTVIHNYKPKTLTGQGFKKFANPLLNFKDNSFTSNYGFDTSASSSNIVTSEDKNINAPRTFSAKRGKKKSISTQNISFGGSGHQTTVDHWDDTDIASFPNEQSPSGNGNYNFEQTQPLGTVTPMPFTIKESSPMHSYYSDMARKALHSHNLSVPQASNDNFQYVEAPVSTTTPYFSLLATTAVPPEQKDVETVDTVAFEQSQYQEAKTRQRSSNKENNSNVSHNSRPRKRIRALKLNTLPEDSPLTNPS